MDEFRRETRPETVDRVIQRAISAHGTDDELNAIRTYKSENINKYEIAEWLLSHQTVINNIMSSDMLTYFIAEITSEITSGTRRLQRMQSTKLQLETRLQELQQQQQPMDVEHGGSRRRRASKHSKKSRKSKSRRTKTKSRRH